MSSPANRSSRLESWAFYILLATVILSPLAFWPSQYFAIEAVKTIVIAMGTIVPLILLGLAAAKSPRFSLPPKSLVWTSVLVVISVVSSAIASGHFLKSFFGQGFEIGAGSFIVLMFAAMFTAYLTVVDRTERIVMFFAGLAGSFLFIVLLEVLRLAFGPSFLSFGILSTITSVLLGSWFGLGAYAIVVLIIGLLGIMILPLSRRMRWLYWFLIVVAMATAYLVNANPIWQAAAVTFLGLTVYLSLTKKSLPGQNQPSRSLFRRLAWLPMIFLVFSLVMVWHGTELAGPAVSKLGLGYSELTLPWQMTLDVTAGAIKSAPLLGVGPNRFVQAFLDYKPVALNTTNIWGVEFTSGFGLLPTFVATEGLLGLLAWIVFLVFVGILGVRSLRKLFVPSNTPPETVMPADQAYAHFVILASFTAAAFLWLVSIVYVPTHVIWYLTFILSGIWLAAAVTYGRLSAWTCPDTKHSPEAPAPKRFLSVVLYVLAIVAVLWGLVFLKNTIALAYFDNGVSALNNGGDALSADAAFRAALALNPLDIYWQGRAEAGIALANQEIAQVTATSTASTTQAVAAEAAATVNQTMNYAASAVTADPDNYYNYLSMARVAELAVNLKMSNGYETAVNAYENAISRNPGNPSLYVSLARLQAAQSKFDDALKTVGAALQVKSDYLDAVFLLSQIEAAKGNLPDAITAANFAIGLNPQNSLLYFQLGLLQYENNNYASSSEALSQAITLQPDYANAEYFLGLAQARQGRTADAIAIFTNLAKTNPDNQQIALILATLKAGKPLFTGPASKAATAERQTQLPVPSK